MNIPEPTQEDQQLLRDNSGHASKKQCKVPLFPKDPGIHICILEAGHEGLHHTYGRDDIYFTARGRD